MADPRIAVCSWSLRPEDQKHLIGGLRSVGLECVQLGLSPLAADPEAGAAAIDEIREGGVEIISGMMAMEGEDYSSLDTIARTGGVRPDATWPANRRHAEAVARLAAQCGIDLVTFHAGFIPEDPGDPEREVLLGRLREIARLFADRNIALAFETGQETAETLAEALDDLGAVNVGVNFDPANMILYARGDPVRALTMLAPRIRQIHVKDAVPTDTPGTWGREVPAGTGAVDWQAFFAVARTIKPPVNYVIEREAGENREPDIITARNLITESLATN